ncbi:DMT family transporter [Agathobaculum sp.]|uniref:DMT family transporter n=1 Tax=Agathobaculum sp. TaxID=2048138 RepID=UPI003FA478E5
MSLKLRHSLLLLLTATIWGFSLVAQRVGMDHLGPFAFLCARGILGGSVLLVPALLLGRSSARAATPHQRRAERKQLLCGGVLCGALRCAACGLQQIGLLYTTVGKGGFLTACYILIVPLLGLLLGRKCGRQVWGSVALALVGLYFLCLSGELSLGVGDALCFAGAFFFAAHIIATDRFSPHVSSLALSCLQFYVCAAFSAVGMLLFELPKAPLNVVGFAAPSWGALLAAWIPLRYAGVLTSGVADTLQIVGQRGMNPTVASLILSLESVVSVIAGWLLLGQTLTARELLGCALMFIAILLAQLPGRQAAADA